MRSRVQAAILLLLASPAGVVLAQGAPGATAILKLTEPQDDYPAVSPDGREILFQSNRTGKWQIWSMRRDGSVLRRWSDNSANDRQPAWSPDGRFVAFSSDQDQASGQRAIFVSEISPAGVGARRQLTRGTGQDVHPKWLPDGNGLIFNRIAADGKQADVYRVTLDGQELKIDLGSGLNTYASVDRRSRFMVYRGTTWETSASGIAENSDVFTARPDGSGKRRLTTGAAFDGWPAISPDGGSIAFASRQGGDRFQLYLMPSEGGVARLVRTPPGYHYTQPAWAPDGRSLIVYRWTQDSAGEVGHLVEVPLPQPLEQSAGSQP